MITDLLKTYGQGGNTSVTMDFRYHNSFLIADTCEAWILDTVNRRWVARRVKNAEGISNCYSTGEHWMRTPETSRNMPMRWVTRTEDRPLTLPGLTAP